MEITGTISAFLADKAKEVWSVTPTTTVFEAAATMAARNVGALLVMPGEDLVGMISERDYTRKVALRGQLAKELQVQEIMTRSLTTVRPGATVILVGRGKNRA